MYTEKNCTVKVDLSRLKMYLKETDKENRKERKSQINWWSDDESADAIISGEYPPQDSPQRLRRLAEVTYGGAWGYHDLVRDRGRGVARCAAVASIETDESVATVEALPDHAFRRLLNVLSESGLRLSETACDFLTSGSGGRISRCPDPSLPGYLAIRLALPEAVIHAVHVAIAVEIWNGLLPLEKRLLENVARPLSFAHFLPSLRALHRQFWSMALPSRRRPPVAGNPLQLPLLHCVGNNWSLQLPLLHCVGNNWSAVRRRHDGGTMARGRTRWRRKRRVRRRPPPRKRNGNFNV